MGSPVHPPARVCSCVHPHVGEYVCTMGVCNWVCKHGGVHFSVCVCVCVHVWGPHCVSGHGSVWVGSMRVGWRVLSLGTTRWCPASISPFEDPNLHPVEGHGGGAWRGDTLPSVG